MQRGGGLSSAVGRGGLRPTTAEINPHKGNYAPGRVLLSPLPPRLRLLSENGIGARSLESWARSRQSSTEEEGSGTLVAACG